jgi:phosphoribosyl 1,2-cyclic phosphate phosphodiesterase
MANRRFTFLGTGTSTGVPALGCDCGVCVSTDPRNKRNRCAAVITTAQGNLLIDTPPELRLELLATGFTRIHSVLFTHYHADHLFGLDDLRQFPKFLGAAMPVYCTDEVEQSIRTSFSYIFAADGAPTTTYLPKLEFHRIRAMEAFQALGERVLPLDLVHAQFRTLGFKIGNIAYCTDVNRIPDMSWPHLENLDVLVLDALRYRPHPAHLGYDEALEIIGKLKPKQAYLTHLSHDFDYEKVSAELPANVQLGYDGLSFEF